jgi:hypothetical protein
MPASTPPSETARRCPISDAGPNSPPPLRVLAVSANDNGVSRRPLQRGAATAGTEPGSGPATTFAVMFLRLVQPFIEDIAYADRIALSEQRYASD